MASGEKLVLKLVAVLVLVAVFTLPAFTVEAKEVTLRIFARAYTWNQEAPWEVAKAEIQRRHPDIKFTFVEEGFGWADLRSKFLTSAAGGNPPDVVQVDIIWVGEYVDQNHKHH